MGRMSVRGGSDPGTCVDSLKIVRRPPFVILRQSNRWTDFKDKVTDGQILKTE